MDTCHSIPCKISYSGPASITEYFRPADIPLELTSYSHKLRKETTNDDINGNNRTVVPGINSNSSNSNTADTPSIQQSYVQFQAATFRGRGLLAAVPRRSYGEDNPTETELQIDGCLLEVLVDQNKSVKEQVKLHPVVSFSSITEWHTEHDVNHFKQQHEEASFQQNNRKARTDLHSFQHSQRVQSALDWIETASVLHAPIPFD